MQICEWCNLHSLKRPTDPTKWYLTILKLNLFLTLQYEPVFESTASVPYLNHIILYECPGSSPALEVMSRENGRPCYSSDSPVLTCTSIVAAWTRGSEVNTYKALNSFKFFILFLLFRASHFPNKLVTHFRTESSTI